MALNDWYSVEWIVLSITGLGHLGGFSIVVDMRVSLQGIAYEDSFGDVG